MANRHTKPEPPQTLVIDDVQTKIAIRVASHANASDEKFSIDPFTIMAIINCIIAVIKLLYMCYSENSVSSKIKKRNIIHNFLLKREIRKQFTNQRDRKAVYTAMLDVSSSLSDSEIKDLLNSINN